MPKKLILLIGAPGSGKTTDAYAIAGKHPEITSYSIGELLKEEGKKNAKLAKINEGFISHGDLVPTAITIDTLCTAIQNAPTQIVLVDGFPRKEKQMKIFGDIVQQPDRVDLISVIEVRVSEAVARERVLGKEGHNDEQEEMFAHKMKIYQETIASIEAFYNEDHLLKVDNGEREASVVIDEIDEFLKSQIELTSI